MANYGLKSKGNVKTDDDVAIQLGLLQPTVTESDTFLTISPAIKTKSNGQTVKAYTNPRTTSSFAGGSVDLSLYVGSVPSNNYVLALVTINAVDGIEVVLGTPSPTLGGATEPTSLNYQIALVTLHKTGATLDNITNASLVDRRPLNQINGAPVHYAAGDEIATEQYLVEIADSFVALPNSPDNSIDFTVTSISQFSSSNLMTMHYSTRSGSVAGNVNVTITSVPSFTVRPNCWVNIGGVFRRIVTVTNQQSYVVASPGFSNGAATVTVLEPVQTKNLYTGIGDATQGDRVIDNFTDLVSAVLVDYDDSFVTLDKDYDSGTPNVICLVSTASVDNYVTTLRPTQKAGFVNEVVMPDPQQSLTLVFLPNYSTGDGTVNLLGYFCFFIKDGEEYRGGIFNTAFGFTDQASGLNCAFSVSGGNKTLVSLTTNFPTYVRGVNPGTPYGDLSVYDEGIEIPRYTAGVTDVTLPYYTEVSDNQIELWGLFNTSGTKRQIAVVRRFGTIDNTDTNAGFIAGLKDFGSGTLYGVPESGCANGNVVTFNGAAFVPAQANNSTNAAAVGIINNINAGVGDVVMSGNCSNVLSGLLPGNKYYLSQSTPGALVTPKPVSGIYVLVGEALSANRLAVGIQNSLVLADQLVDYLNPTAEFNNGNSGASHTIDWNNGSNQRITLDTASVTLTLSNPKAGGVYLLFLKQDVTGGRTVTWPGTVVWSGGITPTLTTTGGRIDLVNLYWNGTNYFANVAYNFNAV